ncbi:MAG: GtrA family protein [Coriobacteriia bacterium]|nr:GtrA family protein [Coriobacteriia bacterium]
MSLLRRVTRLYERNGEQIRFLIVGVWNTAFSVGVLWLLDHFISYDAHSLFQKEAVLLLSWVIAVTQNFFTFKLLVFRTKGHWLREYLRMYVTYSLTFLVQSVVTLAISQVFHLSVFWANLPTIAIVTIFSYLGHKYFTFRHRHVIEALDAGEVFETQE